MAWTSADVTACKAALLQALAGRSVSYEGRNWTSQDVPVLRAMLAEMERSVAGTAAPSSRVAEVSKGV